MKLTIGMACYQDFDSVWFTVQALRMYHGKDIEILLVDNYGDDRLFNWVKGWGSGQVRYERYTEIVGTSRPRHMVFELAKGEFVICMDSHVMLMPDALNSLPDDDNLYHGPMVYDNLMSYVTHMKPKWRSNMWGVWADAVPEVSSQMEIPMHGLGLFGCRKDAWLGFNENFRGFGGEEGYIHEKYRQAGRKVILLPSLKWLHLFREGSVPYPLHLKDRIRNYLIGFDELGLDKTPIYRHFGREIVERIENTVSRQRPVCIS